MKFSFFITLFLLLYFSVFGQPPMDRCDGMFGPVKSVVQTTYQAKLAKGVLVRKKITAQTQREFNASGFLVLNMILNHYMPGQYSYKEVYSYVADTLAVTMEAFLPNGQSRTRHEYAYDSLNRCIEYREYTINKNPDMRVVYGYGNGPISNEIWQYNFKNELVYHAKYDIDERGRTLRIDSEYMGVVSRTEREWDDEGNTTYSNSYNASGERTHSSQHVFDQNGRVILYKSHDWANRLTAHQTFAYDQFGNTTEEISFGQQGDTLYHYNFAYEYDQHQNWVVKYERRSEKLGFIVERKINYYE